MLREGRGKVRFIRLVSLFWLVIVAMLWGMVLYARTSPASDTLQVIGFGVCNGTSCFQGIQPGMNWQELEKRFPSGEDSAAFGRFSLNFDNPAYGVDFYGSEQGTTISAIASRLSRLSIPVGQFVARYGAPCRVNVGSYVNVPLLILIYPDWNVFIVGDAAGVQFTPDTAMTSVVAVRPQVSLGCHEPPSQFFGVWQGFTSDRNYLQRFSPK